MRILVVDDFEETRELLTFTIGGFANAECIEAESATQAIDHLRSGIPFDLVIVDAIMPGQPGSQVILWGIENKIRSQFVFLSGLPPSDCPPIAPFQEFIWHLPKPFLGKNVQELLERYSHDHTESSDRDYIPVVLPLLRKINVIPIPLFIRINDHKFIRLTSGVTDFNDEEFFKYKHRGVKELYIESANSEKFIQEFRSKAFEDETWKGPIDPSAPKLDFQSEAVLGVSSKLGLDSATQTQLKETTDRTLSIVSQRAELGSLLKEFRKANRWGLSDRTALTLTVAAGLLRSTGEWNDTAVKTMTFSTILHDMAISDMQLFTVKKAIRLIELDMESGNPDVIRVREHSAKAAESAKQIPACPKEVSSVVLAHHEKPNGKGLPKHSTASELSFLQSVFIFSVDFATSFVESEGTMDVRSFLVVRRDLYNESHFRVIHALFSAAMKPSE